MGKKNTFKAIPKIEGWQPLLKKLEIDDPQDFHNRGNVVANGRQAIKVYYRNARKGNVPPRRFKTKTNTEQHSFTIWRYE